MTSPDPVRRRSLLALTLGTFALWPASALAAGPRRKDAEPVKGVSAAEFSLDPGRAGDQSSALQAAIDQAALRRVPLVLPPGRFQAGTVRLRPGTILEGAGAATVIALAGPGAGLVGEGAHALRLERFAVDGRAALATGPESGLIDLRAGRDIAIADVTIQASPANALALQKVSGRVTGCRIEEAGSAAIRSLDAEGLTIAGNDIRDCADNGILVWRSRIGEDGTTVTANRIERIAARSGGTGQNGNAINLFRAGGVLVEANRIADCAYSAIRANQSSNVQMIANSAQRIGEVALYAEFGFEGALIASNLVDHAACGISVTNFNEGGRLAVIQGNLIRNLFRREHEPIDRRGEGIAVEADASITGNTIEGAATAGIVIGWGSYMRNVVAASNMIRAARVGILITGDPEAGTCLVAQNLIASPEFGAIRHMSHGLPIGEDLIRATATNKRIAVTGNIAT